MTHPFLPILIGIISFLLFIFYIVTGIKRKNFLRIPSSFAFVLVLVLCFLWLGILAAGKATSKATEAIDRVKSKFASRTGAEIYLALFGEPANNCLEVVNKTDQVVPRLDCCIWLDFKTCPEELRRIINLENYQSAVYNSSDTAKYIPTYSPKPSWWTPNNLNKTVIVLRSYNSDNPNRDKVLIFASDSTHAYYCDMAD